jgi:hypothetical protein
LSEERTVNNEGFGPHLNPPRWGGLKRIGHLGSSEGEVFSFDKCDRHPTSFFTFKPLDVYKRDMGVNRLSIK